MKNIIQFLLITMGITVTINAATESQTGNVRQLINRFQNQQPAAVVQKPVATGIRPGRIAQLKAQFEQGQQNSTMAGEDTNAPGYYNLHPAPFFPGTVETPKEQMALSEAVTSPGYASMPLEQVGFYENVMPDNAQVSYYEDTVPGHSEQMALSEAVISPGYASMPLEQASYYEDVMPDNAQVSYYEDSIPGYSDQVASYQNVNKSVAQSLSSNEEESDEVHPRLARNARGRGALKSRGPLQIGQENMYQQPSPMYQEISDEPMDFSGHIYEEISGGDDVTAEVTPPSLPKPRLPLKANSEMLQAAASLRNFNDAEIIETTLKSLYPDYKTRKFKPILTATQLPKSAKKELLELDLLRNKLVKIMTQNILNYYKTQPSVPVAIDFIIMDRATQLFIQRISDKITNLIGMLPKGQSEDQILAATGFLKRNFGVDSTTILGGAGTITPPGSTLAQSIINSLLKSRTIPALKPTVLVPQKVNRHVRFADENQEELTYPKGEGERKGDFSTYKGLRELDFEINMFMKSKGNYAFYDDSGRHRSYNSNDMRQFLIHIFGLDQDLASTTAGSRELFKAYLLQNDEFINWLDAQEAAFNGMEQ